MQNQTKSQSAKKLTSSIVIILLLSLCLAVTTFALTYSIVSVDNNLFAMGTVKINLNNGNPIISENEFLFEPGMTVKKDFFVKNESSCDIYYKLYFQNISGRLADVLEVTICDRENVLYQGTPASLSQENVLAADDVLRVDEMRNLQIYFHFPEESGNQTQDSYLTFDFAANGVQTKNNPDKNFD